MLSADSPAQLREWNEGLIQPIAVIALGGLPAKVSCCGATHVSELEHNERHRPLVGNLGTNGDIRGNAVNQFTRR